MDIGYRNYDHCVAGGRPAYPKESAKQLARSLVGRQPHLDGELLDAGAPQASLGWFEFRQMLQPREDRIRTWTLQTQHNPHQLTNGLKLLLDRCFISVRRA